MTTNRSRHRPAIAVAALFLLWLAMLLLGTGSVDRGLVLEAYAGDRPILANLALALTYLGGWIFVTIAAIAGAVALAFRRKLWSAVVLLIGPVIGRGLIEIQKFELGRLRPNENEHLVAVHNLSFPSGHSANGAMIYVLLVLLLARDRQRSFWLAGAALLAFAIGLSRIMLGVHWPSDVVAGWSFGLVWALLLAWVSRHPPSWAFRR